MITVCVGGSCDAPCLLPAATSPRWFYSAPRPTDQSTVFETIRLRSTSLALNNISVVDPLPADMQYVIDSADPPPSDTGVGFDAITWEMDDIPDSGITFTLEVLPLEVGCHPTNTGATGTFMDILGRGGAFAFPDPVVCVLNPLPLETPTEPPATETVVTPIPSETPTATSTSESRTLDVFLPAVLNLNGD